jgi:PIN domain nuclease of toxin-antitoxin system
VKTFVIDTHTLVWFLSRSPRLSGTVLALLHDPTVRLIIPAIVLAEIKYLSSRGRFAQTLDDVLRVVSTDPRCVLVPIDLNVIQHAPASLDIHDGLIVLHARCTRAELRVLLAEVYGGWRSQR